tara:strand:- start:77 stop:499 length:423 start_codon:yes stop_codon:yes gene_type:complete
MAKRKSKVKSELNVVPYIDVMLVLLIIFMVTAPMLNQGVKVDLPNSKSKTIEIDDSSEVIIWTVDKSGKYYLSNTELEFEKPLTIKEALAYTKNAKEKNNNIKVFLRGDKDARYDSIVVALASLKNLGINNVNLMTKEID